jgi:hypothetical protein
VVTVYRGNSCMVTRSQLPNSQVGGGNVYMSSRLHACGRYVASIGVGHNECAHREGSEWWEQVQCGEMRSQGHMLAWAVKSVGCNALAKCSIQLL